MFKNFFPNKILSLTNKTINNLVILLVIVVLVKERILFGKKFLNIVFDIT